MEEGEVPISLMYGMLNNTILYQEWMKEGSYSEDIMDMVPDGQQVGNEEDEISASQSSSIIELHFYLGRKVKLALLRKSRVFNEESKYFVVTLETVKTDMVSGSPKNIELSIKIRGEKLSSSRTKLSTSFKASHVSSLFVSSIEDALSDVISGSLANIPLFCYEIMLKKNLEHFSIVRENLLSRKRFEQDQQEEKIKLQNIVNSQSNQNTADSQGEMIRLPQEEILEDHKEVFKYHPDGVADRDTFIKDEVWLKWCTERLENEEQLNAYKQLRERIHDQHNYREITESVMLRFLHGMEYNVDDAEKKIIYHVKFMNDNDLWHIDVSRIPNIHPHKIFCIHKEDIYGRPLIYTRVNRFLPSKYSFEELRDYGFWHFENMRKAFKPHVESHLGIYDMKGLGKKNVNIATLKKSIPVLEDNLPEVGAKMIVIRPSFFLNMIWRMVKPFLHELTLKKIQFLPEKKMSEELLKFIEPENLPQGYGGEDYEFEEKFD